MDGRRDARRAVLSFPPISVASWPVWSRVEQTRSDYLISSRDGNSRCWSEARRVSRTSEVRSAPAPCSTPAAAPHGDGDSRRPASGLHNGDGTWSKHKGRRPLTSADVPGRSTTPPITSLDAQNSPKPGPLCPPAPIDWPRTFDPRPCFPAIHPFVQKPATAPKFPN